MTHKSLALYYDLLQDLTHYLSVSEYDALLRQEKVDVEPWHTVAQSAAISLANAFIKKSTDDVLASADEAALHKFLNCNTRCKEWVCEKPRTSWEEELLGTFKWELHKFFVPSDDSLLGDLCNVLAHGRLGPGASIDSVGGDFYTKLFSSKLTSTSKSLLRAYGYYISSQPEWVNAELIRQIHYGTDNIVVGSRLSFVPKQRDISRIICVEPVLNMFGQLGAGALIEKRLINRFGINLSIQPDRNRELARRGSIDGSLFTCDLSSASDTISLKMLRHYLDPETMGLLEMLRSPRVVLPKGGELELEMVSSMGNGFTFPLETAIFSCVLVAAMKVHGVVPKHGRGSSPGNWGVFGDDLVGPKETYGSVCYLLKHLGFIVNETKSFNEGAFRESCGHDYLSGQNVRGVYVKTLETNQDRAVVLNLLHRWSSQTGIMLNRVVRSLYKSLPKVFVPYWENDDAGIKVPLSLLPGPIVYDHHTKAIQYRKWMGKTTKLRLEDWRYLATKLRIYNPYGLWISFLAGHVRNGCVTPRQEVRYRYKAELAPSWDPPRQLLATGASWQRWETAVWLTVKG